MDILLRQDRIPDALGKQLVDMYRDGSHDNVWRDYCIQYMSACYDAVKPTGVETNAADIERKEIAKSYDEALLEKDKTIAGTALIAVEQLSRDHAEFDRKHVGETALCLATDDRCGEAARITALRVCGMLGKSEVVPVARVLAQTGESVALRMAAAATLGDLGEKADMELLQSLSAGSEKRVSTVASSAVARLIKRIEGK